MRNTQYLIAGETVLPLPECALFWPAQHVLFIADAHFGKAAAFRRLGAAVPEQTTTENLETLSRLVTRYGVRQLIFLGDFLHARAAHNPHTLDALQAWRDTHAHVRMALVRGNHDEKAGDPPASLRMEMLEEPYQMGVFSLCHHPQSVPESYVLCGHLHPAIRLQDKLGGVRLPCFWFGKGRGVLPAFGAFTGTHVVRPLRTDSVFAIAGERTIRVQ